MHYARLTSFVILLAALALARAAAGQPSPQDRERQVNSYTTGAQSLPAVSSDPDGNFVVVWQSLGSGGNDNSLSSIQAQRYDRIGRKTGAQFQVNSYTSNIQIRASVGSDALGNFVVVWDSVGSSLGDSSGRSILGQRFAANGVPVGTEFQVNSYTTNNQYYPGVGVTPDGHFLVVWESDGSLSTDTNSTSIQARLYDGIGNPVSDQFQVNDVTTGFQELPVVAAAGNGDFIVAWKHNGAGINDGLSVQARQVPATGTPVVPQFQVNSYTSGMQTQPTVAADANGNFVVAWENYPDAGISAVQAALFDALGGAVTGEFQVNTYTTGDQTEPGVAMAPNGEFVVTWQSDGSASGDTSLDSVHAQRFDASGSSRDTEFQVNTYTTNNQMLAGVAIDGAGNFVIVWESQGSFDGDASDKSVQQRRYDALFRDGFETGTTARWSATVG
ncbi:MAG: hypothetical protein ABIV06_05575 [Thermoanaerobaculia bacterium]